MEIRQKQYFEACTLYNKFVQVKLKLSEQVSNQEIKSSIVPKIEELYSNIERLYLKISELCLVDVVEKSTNMEKFNLKTAVSLLPVMSDNEDSTKQLISNIEMYGSMLDDSGKPLLITFVLKSRLDESAKLRLRDSYPSVSDLISDMKDRLLTKKSDTAILQKLQQARQDRRSIEEFGKEI